MLTLVPLLLTLAQIEYPAPKDLPPANGYSHIVTAKPDKLVFIAGQVSMDKQGKIVGPGDLRAQTEQALSNLKTALAAAGANFTHVVKINWYIKNFNSSQLPTIREVRAKFLPATNPPASTLVGVAELFNPEALIEIEAIAVLPGKP